MRWLDLWLMVCHSSAQEDVVWQRIELTLLSFKLTVAVHSCSVFHGFGLQLSLLVTADFRAQ